MQNKPTSKQQVEISIYKGDKLLNENTPFVVNLLAPESKEQTEKKVNADLICVIDISGSMSGGKIHLVRESLKVLIDMMDPKDRIALVLFSSDAQLYYDLNNLTSENKSKLKNLINNINASGGTNIASGLQIAVDILKKEKNETTKEAGRSSSVLLLSDGQDNYLNDEQLGEKLKSFTKGEGLSFTLNTFGYGYDHDPKIMNKLASLRDGSFFLVEDYNKVGEYFVAVLGGCISAISKNCELNIKLLNNDCKIAKIFGKNNLYSYELKDNSFSTKMLQFISGKEYTYVFEIKMDESKIKPGDNLFEVSFKYEDINDQITKTVMSNYKYEIKDLNFAKANEEYIRSYVYDVLEEAIKLRESYKYEDWIKANYKGDNKDYLNDIEKSEKMFDMNDINSNRNFIFANCQVRQMQNKRMGSNNMYMNNCQAILQNNYQMNFAMSQQAAPSPYNMNFGNQSYGIPNAMPMMNNIQAPLMQNNMQAQQMQNNIQAPPIFQQMPMSQFNPMYPPAQQMPPNSQNLNPMNKNH